MKNKNSVLITIAICAMCCFTIIFFIPNETKKMDGVNVSGQKEVLDKQNNDLKINLGDIANCADATGDCTITYVSDNTDKILIDNSDTMPTVCLSALPTATDTSPSEVYLECEDQGVDGNHKWYGVYYEKQKSCTGICKKCNAGYYLNDDTTCAICPKGYYCPGEFIGEISGYDFDFMPCDPNYYQDQEGQTTCKACPSGKGTLLGVEATSIDSCVSCPDAYPGTVFDEKYGCSCQPGRYWEDVDTGKCSACPDGQYQDKKNQFSCKSCSESVNENKTACSAVVITCPDVIIGIDEKCTINTGKLDGIVTSSDESMFTIKDIKDTSFYIVGKKEGTGTVTAKVNGKDVTTTVEINGGLPLTNINITSPDTLEFSRVGESKAIEYEAVPKNSYAKIEWSSSDTSIAEIGKTGVLLAKKAGTVTITAKSSTDSSITVSKKFTISINNETVDCYLDTDGKYHWTSSPQSSWTNYDVSTEEECMANNKSSEQTATSTPIVNTPTPLPTSGETTPIPVTPTPEVTPVPTLEPTPEPITYVDECFKNESGEYVWGKYQNDSRYTKVSSVTNKNSCNNNVNVPSTGIDMQKFMYIIVAIMMAFGIGIIYYSSIRKQKNQ